MLVLAESLECAGWKLTLVVLEALGGCSRCRTKGALVEAVERQWGGGTESEQHLRAPQEGPTLPTLDVQQAHRECMQHARGASRAKTIGSQ